MTVKKGKSLTEAAAEVLARSVSQGHADAFGAGTKLVRTPGAGQGPAVIDLGVAHTKADQSFPDFTRGVPRATPPGATPPVGQQPMPKLSPQPQQSQGGGDNGSPEGKEPKTAQQRADRDEDNPYRKVKPGQGNKPQTGSTNEEFTDEELDEVIAEMKIALSDCDDKNNDGKKDKKQSDDSDDDSDDNDGDEDNKKKNLKFKFSKKFSKEGKDKVKEALELSDEELDSMILEDEEVDEDEEVLPTIGEAIQTIAAEILETHKAQITEDVEAMFSGETLSEDFKAKVATVFNAAVATRVDEIVAKLETVIEEQLDAQVAAIKEDLTESVDGYLNYTVNEWVKDNEIAIQKGLKTEIMEDFIVGMRNLFIEHYIDIPEEKMDLVGELQEKIDTLEADLNEEIEKNISLVKVVSESHKELALTEACKGLTDVQADKIRTLAENVDFASTEDFSGKVTTLIESYFPSGVKKQATDALDNDQEVLTEQKETSPIMKAYVQVIKNGIR